MTVAELSAAELTAGEKAARFLREAEKFRLGQLPTEGIRRDTSELSTLAVSNPAEAISLLLGVDIAALKILPQLAARFSALGREIGRVLDAGGRVFLCGCGSTGRLVINLEYLFGRRFAKLHRQGRVIAFMSGGDVALIRSIENFEDFAEYGQRHLQDLGITADDLLISCTEGGETPYVIGATEYAASVTRRPPWFLYCNPDEALAGIERSRKIIENSGIQKICLPTGPMSLAGSTRLQACTVMMLGLGRALLHRDNADSFRNSVSEFIDVAQNLDLGFLSSYIIEEARIYQRGQCALYMTRDYGLTILTDTTERAPTFSIAPFEGADEDADTPSICFMHFPHSGDTREAWWSLLGRRPRTLEWAECSQLTGEQRLLGFDFSRRGLRSRRLRTGGRRHWRFIINRVGRSIDLRLGRLHNRLVLPFGAGLEEQVILKMLLNIHSTLVMGRLGRYQGNMMTWVKPSCNKLVDRAVRYVDRILRQAGHKHSYKAITQELFRQIPHATYDESVVMRTVSALSNRLEK